MAQNFATADSGAVTVDWVVLTGALVGLGLAAMSVVSGGVEDLSGDTEAVLKRDDIIQTSFNADCSGYSLDCIWDAWLAFDALTVEDNSGYTKDDMAAELAGIAEGSNEVILQYAFGDMTGVSGDLAEGIRVSEIMNGYTGSEADRLALAQHYGMSSAAELQSAVTGAGYASMEDFEAEQSAKGDFYGQFRLAMVEEAENRGLSADDI